MAKFYRFELAFNGEPQDVGFLQGLDEVGFDDEYLDALYALFDSLPVPPFNASRMVTHWFTEKGLAEFWSAIAQVHLAIQNRNWQLIWACIDANIEEACYSDDFQAAFRQSYITRIVAACGKIQYKELDCGQYIGAAS